MHINMGVIMMYHGIADTFFAAEHAVGICYSLRRRFAALLFCANQHCVISLAPSTNCSSKSKPWLMPQLRQSCVGLRNRRGERRNLLLFSAEIRHREAIMAVLWWLAAVIP